MSCKRDPDCKFYLEPAKGYTVPQCKLRPLSTDNDDGFWGHCPLTCERHRSARERHCAQKSQMEFGF